MASNKYIKAFELTPLQEGMLLHSLEGSSGTYVEQLMYTFHGELDLVFFEKALTYLVDQHEVLRTIVLHDKLSSPKQVVLEKPLGINFAHKDISDLSVKSQNSHINDYLSNDRSRSFDVSREPLFRVQLFQLQKKQVI